MAQFNKWLTWALFIGIFAVPFIPFIIATDFYFPFITGKNFAFRIIIDVLVAVFILLALRDPAYRPRFSWMSIAVLALALVTTLSTLLSVDPVKSFWSNFERMEGLVGLLHLTAWFFIVGVVLSTEKLWNRFLQVSLIASVIMGIYVCLQVGGAFTINQGGIRTDGTFGNAIYLAVYMLFHMFFTLLLAVRHRGAKWVYALYAVAFILQGIGLYFAATRSATLGLLGGLLVVALGLVVFEKENKRLRHIAFGTIAAVMLIVAVFFSIRTLPWVTQDPVLTRFASISTDETTVKSRFMIWGMAARGFSENPVFGWGLDNFNFVFNTYYNPQMWGQEQWFDRAHNAFVDWAIAGGILGLLAFLSLFGIAAFVFMRASSLSVAERSILVGLLCAYAFHSLFVFDNLMSSVYFFALLALAHGLSRSDLPRAMFLTRPMNDGMYAVLAPVAGVVVLVGAYFLNAPGITTATTLIDGLSPEKTVVGALGETTAVQKDPLENLESFKRATESSLLGKQEATEQLLQIASSAATAEGLNPSVRSAFVTLATEKGAELLKERPNDARLELFYGSFLNLAGNTEGIAHLRKAHELSPNKQTISFELGINGYLRSGNTTDSVAVLKQAYELAPEYPEAAIYYALALFYSSKADDADAVLTKTFGSTIVDDDRILSVYTDANVFDRIAGIWEKRVTKDPSNPDARISLAGSYASAGNRAEALTVLRKGLKDLPQHSAKFTDAAQQLGLSL